MYLRNTISAFIVINSSAVLMSERGINVLDLSFLMSFIFSETSYNQADS